MSSWLNRPFAFKSSNDPNGSSTFSLFLYQPGDVSQIASNALDPGFYYPSEYNSATTGSTLAKSAVSDMATALIGGESQWSSSGSYTSGIGNGYTSASPPPTLSGLFGAMGGVNYANQDSAPNILVGLTRPFVSYEPSADLSLSGASAIVPSGRSTVGTKMVAGWNGSSYFLNPSYILSDTNVGTTPSNSSNWQISPANYGLLVNGAVAPLTWPYLQATVNVASGGPVWQGQLLDLLGVSSISMNVTESFPFCGSAEFLFIPGYRVHGLSQFTRVLNVQGGLVTSTVAELTFGELASLIATLQQASGQAAPAAAMAQLNATPSQAVRVLSNVNLVGPYDIYQSGAIQRAFAQGATQAQVDAYVVAGKTCAEWRNEGLAAAPTYNLMYTVGGLKVPNVCNLLVSFATNSPVYSLSQPLANFSNVALVFNPPNFEINSDPNYTDGVAQIQALYAAANVALPASIAPASTSSALVSDYNALNDPLNLDMPAVWWASLGFTSWTQVMHMIAASLVTPVS